MKETAPLNKAKRLIVLSGIPGSGKSTYARREILPPGVSDCVHSYLIEEDAVRERLFGEGRPHSMKEVRKAMVEEANRLLVLPETEDVYLESVFPDDYARVEIAKAVFGNFRRVLRSFCFVKSTCFARNASREENRRVPESVMEWLSSTYKKPGPTSISYFDDVYIHDEESPDGRLLKEGERL